MSSGESSARLDAVFQRSANHAAVLITYYAVPLDANGHLAQPSGENDDVYCLNMIIQTAPTSVLAG